MAVKKSLAILPLLLIVGGDGSCFGVVKLLIMKWGAIVVVCWN